MPQFAAFFCAVFFRKALHWADILLAFL